MRVRPALLLGLVAFFHAICWIIAPALVVSSPPLDVIENAVWGTEGVLITYKNPALTSLLLETVRQFTGSLKWPVFVLSQLCVAAGVWFIYLLGKPTLGEERSAAGAMALLATYYFTWHTPEFNHDILQIPFWAAIALCLWRATATGTTFWWVMLGLVSAASMFCKLSLVVLLSSCALWLLVDAQARSTLWTRGPWLALITFAIAVLPIAVPLLRDDSFAAIKDYAMTRGHKHSLPILKWIVIQAALTSSVAVALLLSRTREDATTPLAWLSTRRPDELYFRRYLLFMTCVPVLLTGLLAALHGTGTKLMWGVPMLNLVGLLFVSYFTTAMSAARLRKLSILVACLTATLATAFAFNVAYRPLISHRPSRMNWPQEDIAIRMRQIWADETHAPLKIVAGELDNWVSGLVALSGGPVVSVLTEGDFKLSPWITPEQFRKEGALVVWDRRSDAPAQKLYAIIGQQAQRYEEFALPFPGRSIDIGYVIIPPQPE